MLFPPARQPFPLTPPPFAARSQPSCSHCPHSLPPSLRSLTHCPPHPSFPLTPPYPPLQPVHLPPSPLTPPFTLPLPSSRSPLARQLFHVDDDPVLKTLLDDNQRIEPEWYVPIIPMVLVNGAEGIGTGWSTRVPNHDVREVVANVRRMIAGQEPLPMVSDAGREEGGCMARVSPDVQ